MIIPRQSKLQYKYKSKIMYQYNLKKSGIDIEEIEIQYYKTQSRTKKYWKTIFFYIIDVTIKNLSFIYFASQGNKKEEKNMALKFRE